MERDVFFRHGHFFSSKKKRRQRPIYHGALRAHSNARRRGTRAQGERPGVYAFVADILSPPVPLRVFGSSRYRSFGRARWRSVRLRPCTQRRTARLVTSACTRVRQPVLLACTGCGRGGGSLPLCRARSRPAALRFPRRQR